MNWRDTVLSDDVLGSIVQSHSELFEVSMVAQNQAEASFKAGQRSVVEWVESICGEMLEGYAYISRELWQAKLKEWGL